MFIMIGAGSRNRRKAYLGVRICPHCRKLSHFYLIERAQQVSLFLVPVIRWDKHWAIGCSRCQAGFEIDARQKEFCLKQAPSLPDEKQMNEVIEYLGMQVQAMAETDRAILRERLEPRFDFSLDDRSFSEIVTYFEQCRDGTDAFTRFY